MFGRRILSRSFAFSIDKAHLIVYRECLKNTTVPRSVSIFIEHDWKKCGSSIFRRMHIKRASDVNNIRCVMWLIYLFSSHRSRKTMKIVTVIIRALRGKQSNSCPAKTTMRTKNSIEELTNSIEELRTIDQRKQQCEPKFDCRINQFLARSSKIKG